MNNRINNIRFIAAISVVMIHLNIPFMGPLDTKAFDTFFLYIGQYAVPYFLIISGYFWMGKHKKESIFKMLLLQFVLVTLVAIEEATFGGIFTNYVQMSSVQWYLPAVSLMMLIALFIKEEYYTFLFLVMFIVANLMLTFDLHIRVVPFRDVDRFLKYGYMFYFGYILKLLMNNPKFVNFISKYCYIFLGTSIVFQIFNATNSIHNFDQYTTVQFLFTIPLVLYALSPNQDKAFKYNKYALDLFLYHILIVSVFTSINRGYTLLHFSNIPILVLIYLSELLIAVPATICFGKFIRYIDGKYLKLIY